MPLRAALLLALTTLLLAALTATSFAALPIPGAVDLTTPAKRDTEPVILQGGSFGEWAVPQNITLRAPLQDLLGCSPSIDPSKLSDPINAISSNTDTCQHNHYATPDFDTSQFGQPAGTPVDRLLGYRYDAHKKTFVQIPFQVDEQFTRYLSNPASGFSGYSGEDEHTTYAYDREGFRWTQSDPGSPCVAEPDSPVATDPVKGLDSNDEVAFMASDAGPQAPADAKLPHGIEGAKALTVVDPTAGSVSYAYVMKARADGPRAAFNADNGYVTYERDPNAGLFEKSESSYTNYGNAARGTVCDANGNVIRDAGGQPIQQRRRPRDYAWARTSRYQFRYDGRWLMTQIRIAAKDGAGFGPDLVDRWKARAFAQDPSSNTPCCGYEEEDTNWGGSSNLLGEKVGPVRALRETWGADSGTNVIRRESFYREEVRQKTWLRAHVVPPLDGIYAQWDFNAGKVDRFYNSRNPGGVAIDGRDDEVYGNLDDPCNPRWDRDTRSQIDTAYRSAYQAFKVCDLTSALGDNISDKLNAHLSIDPGDLTFSDPNASLGWTETAGAGGSIVDRYQIDKLTDLTPGGAAQSLAAMPYYRDDSCFDDGTGTDPGPKVNLRSGDEPSTAADGTERRCWGPSDGDPQGSDHFYQGSIGTHGLHVLALVDSDNARLQKPLTELVAEQRMVMLPGDAGNVGEQYGRGFEKPLIALPVGFQGGGEEPAAPPANPGTGTGAGGNGNGNGNGGPGGPASPGAGVPATPLSTQHESAPRTKVKAKKRKARRKKHRRKRATRR